MKLGSLFDGIGGFPLAASRYGIEPVWASEIERIPVSITQRHFPQMKHLGDITKINGAEIEPVDIITFGSPCQDLSVAGARAGLAGARSGLFREAIRIIEEMRLATNGKYPTWAVWENVPGALSSCNGLDFRAVLRAFTDSEIPLPRDGRWSGAGMVRGGRCDIAWRVLDAQFWGVAQRRRRIFVVADFGGKRAAEILFKPEGLRGYFEAGREARESIAGIVGEGAAGATRCYDIGEDRRRTPGEYVEQSPTLTSRCGTGGNNVPAVVWPDIARTLTARHDSSPCVDRGQNIVITSPIVAHTLKAKGHLDHRGDGDTLIVTAGFNGWRTAAGTLEYSEDRAPCIQASMPPNMVAYSFDALSSNSMKSNNPVSGCREVDVAKTLDTSPPDPSKNQGGIAVLAIKTAHTKSNGCGIGGVAYTLDGSEPCAVCIGIDSEQNALTDKMGTLRAHTSGGAEQFVATLCVAHGQRDAEICADMSPTLTCAHEQPYIAGGDYAVRRLTPIECERLQGFSDGWTAEGAGGKPISDSARYRALGNSVAVPCVEYIMAGIAEASILIKGE